MIAITISVGEMLGISLTFARATPILELCQSVYSGGRKGVGDSSLKVHPPNSIAVCVCVCVCLS